MYSAHKTLCLTKKFRDESTNSKDFVFVSSGEFPKSRSTKQMMQDAACGVSDLPDIIVIYTFTASKVIAE